ncbi:MAG TPA: hypothetical protein VFF72_10160 [Caldimonas sp.]|nr:hypothetical protein [Caldimonas sp.]
MRLFRVPLTPQSEIGRVVFAVIVSVVATALLLEWAPSPSPGTMHGKSATVANAKEAGSP